MHSLPNNWPIGAAPFVLLLLAIAVLPTLARTQHWWHANRNKLLVAGGAALLTLGYLWFEEGLDSAHRALHHAFAEYAPFVILLGSLFVVSGGIAARCNFTATPRVNAAFLALGAILASVLGTTGASVLLIRPLLQTNSERRHVTHTVIFFIFIVSNIGGTLLPIGDPPLFLGYLAGVPFEWTLSLWPQWATATAILLAAYLAVDNRYWHGEPPERLRLEATHRKHLHIDGHINLLWLAGILAAVILLIPGRDLVGWSVPNFAREGVLVAMAALSLLTTPRVARAHNRFSWGPILEVAALFAGIFVTMQVPLRALEVHGASLGLTEPAHYFWATGCLSAVLDNAPTYLVFLESAEAYTAASGAPAEACIQLAGPEGPRPVLESLLSAVSLGAVFMGALTYVGNGPNFMVKAIAESSGVRMPSFGRYLLWSCCILLPLFVVLTAIFFRG